MAPKRVVVLLCFTIFLFFNNSLRGQFIDISATLGEQIFTTSGTVNGNGLSFYDFNKDGWDDLSISRGSNPPLFFKNQEGSLVAADFEIPYSGVGNIMMLLWADYDNDGDEDLLITKRAGPIELWNNDGAFNFTNVAEEAGFFPGNYDHDGAAFADYNHDGCLDVFITKIYHCSFFSGEQYENKLYKSNCDGTFTDVTIDAGVYLCPLTSFQPVFIDYNKDGWEDIYLINDLVEFPNYLFKNNGDDTFEDVSASTGLGIAIDAMTGTVGDYNNDLLLDIFVTNRPNTGGNYLMINQGDGSYVNQAAELGLGLNYQSWGSVWLDENNDSWEDLFVSIPVLGPPGVFGNEFYINNQGVDFSEGRNQLGFENDFSKTYVCAKGDINNDGYFDLALNNLFTTPFRLFQNLTGTNNYLSLSFEGTYSNRNGVGTWINCFADGQQWVRHTLSGENLISQNSGKQIFGLGAIEIVDSLVVEWNRGTRDVYYNIDVNQHLHLLEGASLTVPFEITYTDDLFLCEGDSLELFAGEFVSYLWSTGDTSQSLVVHTPGVYSVSVTNQFGFSIESLDLVVSPAPINEVNVSATDVSCFGADDGTIEVSFSNSPGIAFQWNTGQEEQLISNLSPGTYSFLAEDSFGCQFFGSTFIEEPQPLSSETIVSNPGCAESTDGSVELIIEGGTLPYLVNWNGEDPGALPAGNYIVTIIDGNGCEFEVQATLVAPEPLEAMIETSNVIDEFTLGSAQINIVGGTPPYQIDWSTGVINESSLDGLIAGDYSVIIQDDNGCLLELSFNIGDAVSVLEKNSQVLFLAPNPVSEYFFVRNCNTLNVDISIYNSLGELITNFQNHACDEPILVPNLNAGFYLVEVGSAKTRFFRLLKLD